MPYVKVSKGEAVSYPYTDSQLKREHKNVSFPNIMSDEIRAQYGSYPVTIADIPDFNQATHKVVENAKPSLDTETNTWVLGHTVVELTGEEIVENDAMWASDMRKQRDLLLEQTDWVIIKALEAGEIVPEEWVSYRNSLRSIPEQEGFPHIISWPVAP